MLTRNCRQHLPAEAYLQQSFYFFVPFVFFVVHAFLLSFSLKN